MPTSVMPKGVEHSLTVEPPFDVHVMPTSVMPKGVEHSPVHCNADQTLHMPTSVMPKGVEHISRVVPRGRSAVECPPL